MAHPDDPPITVTISVCASCGRAGDQAAGKDCDDQDWHLDLTDAEPVPEPALRGDDLVRHLRGRLTYAEDQVALATQLLVAILLDQPEHLLRVTEQRMTEAEGQALQTWREPATMETIYRVVPR